MSGDIYVKLREFLNNLPGGYPETETGVEIKILKKLFTSEEANILLNMTAMPEPASAIAQRMGMDEIKGAETIESMAKKGLILRVRMGDDVFYMAMSFIVGIFEFQVNRMDREFSEMMEAYFPYIAKLWSSTKTQQLRVVPLNSAVGAASAVGTYDQIRELIKGKELISVAPCVCAQEKELVGEPCSRPTERCIQFDIVAQYYLENNMSRKISEEELMEILNMAEEKALIVSPANTKEINNICLCCDCCCGHLRMLKMGGHPAEQVQSSFLAQIDPDLCSACGVCEDRCQMDAVTEGEDVYEIDIERCIGCALCVPTCPEEAISLIDKPGVEPVPENMIETNIKIATERGLM